MDDPFFSIAADDAGNAGVGSGGAGIAHLAQIVAPLGFHHGIHIHPRRKAGAQGHGDGGHVPTGSQIFLGKNGIHNRKGAKGLHAVPCRVNQHGKRAFLQAGACLRCGICKQAGHPLHGLTSLVHGLGKGHISADGGGVLRFQHQHIKAALTELVNRPGGQVAAAPDEDEVFVYSRHMKESSFSVT